MSKVRVGLNLSLAALAILIGVRAYEAKATLATSAVELSDKEAASLVGGCPFYQLVVGSAECHIFASPYPSLICTKCPVYVYYTSNSNCMDGSAYNQSCGGCGNYLGPQGRCAY